MGKRGRGGKRGRQTLGEKIVAAVVEPVGAVVGGGEAEEGAGDGEDDGGEMNHGWGGRLEVKCWFRGRRLCFGNSEC